MSKLRDPQVAGKCMSTVDPAPLLADLASLLPLDKLGVGQPARVGQVVGQPEHVRRLRELGFRDGELVEIVRAGRPCIVQLGSKRLCFRAADMLGVLVQPGT
ncbi:MAG: ferrous iron transport protein A [Planctomycetales bacterium]|nr:ferrous iron transport protein A [Planctomycetales bacterium]NIM09596.1 ferrous iron transport protein A [Planctomycetales bacterium]NIN09085.1 ferrous iron transport protein A [Planctomycetales bacterium]NIN78195.1 ferrous iron transport protein A [Planctomycetales bacterium]NIO35381.1 ferrous iron transport protein A [Planctomycetales bacterium]